MKNYLLNCEYKGTHFFGWQIQNNTNDMTVQGELEKAIKLAFKKDNFKTLGASRTDRGVHAFDQYCKLTIDLDINPEAMKKALNDILSSDIRIKSVVECPEDFHPIYSCENKTYQYLFTDKRENIPIFFQDLIYCVQFDLDLISMGIAASKILGNHDFKNFQCVGTDVATTQRNVFKSRIISLSDCSKLYGMNLKNIWVYEVQADGFLKQMIRLLMGGIINVGRGKISVEEFESILNCEQEKRAGKVVGPEGLYLTEINFKAGE